MPGRHRHRNGQLRIDPARPAGLFREANAHQPDYTLAALYSFEMTHWPQRSFRSRDGARL